MNDASPAVEHHPPGPLRLLAHRLDTMRSMSRRLHLVTGLAIAQLVVASVLLAVHDVNMPSTPVAAAARLSSIPNPIFIVCVVFLALAWSYLLGGALHAHWLVRLAALVFFTYTTYHTADGVYLNGFAQWPWISVVAAIWIFALATLWADRPREPGLLGEAPPGRPVPSALRMGVVFLLVLGLYASFRWGGDRFYRTQNTRGFTNLISTQLDDLAIYLVPVLLLAGAEFADWGEIIGERVGVAVERLRPGLGMAALTAVGTGAGAGYLIATSTGDTVAKALLLVGGLIAVAALMRAVRRHQPWPGAVPYVSILIAAGVFFVGLRAERAATKPTTPPAEARAGGRLIEYDHAGAPPFAVRYPAGWEVAVAQDSKDLTLTTFDGILEGYGVALFDVVGERLPPGRLDPADIDHALTDFLSAAGTREKVRVDPAAADGAWRRREFSLLSGGRESLRGVSWARDEGHTLWLLYGLSAPGQATRWRALFDDMRRSWKPEAPRHEATTEDKATAHSSWVAGTWLVVALGAALGLLIFGRRARSRQLLGGAIFLIAVGVLFGISDAGSGLGGEKSFRVAVHTVQLLTAVLSLLGLVGLAAAGRLRTSRHVVTVLLTLNAGLWMLSGMATLYGKASQAGGQFSVAQGLVIFLALMWELTVSGATMTAGDNSVFPRHSRVLLFSGYVTLVATTVLFFSSLKVQATGARVTPQFESETFVQAGILWLGIPLLVCASLFRLRRGQDVAHGAGPST